MATLRRVLLTLRKTINSMIVSNQSPIVNSSLRLETQTPCRPQLDLVSRFCSSNTDSFDDLSNEENKRRILNRMLYRCKQRGFLELDLVLGNWVEENISSMDETRIKALADVLDLGAVISSLQKKRFNFLAQLLNVSETGGIASQENPDLWKWLTGQEPAPEEVNSNPVYCTVRDKVMNDLNRLAAPETRATSGQPWVRGWDDVKKGRDSPVFGNQ